MEGTEGKADPGKDLGGVESRVRDWKEDRVAACPPGSEAESGRVRRGHLPSVQVQSCSFQQAIAWPLVFSH